MNALFALSLVWTLGPVFVAAIALMVSRIAGQWDHAAALATITHAESQAQAPVMARAVSEARLYVTLAARAERLRGDTARAEALRTMARRTLAHAWEISARAAIIPFGFVSVMAAMHASQTADSDPSYIPAVTHCDVRSLSQGSGTVRQCTTLPAVRCTGSGSARVCRTAR